MPQLIRWALSKKGDLQLKVTRFVWPLQVGLPLVDLRVTLVIHRKTYWGRGTDLSDRPALNKALGEALEHYAQDRLKITCMGLSVHQDPGKAKDKAAAEYIERNLFYRHYALGEPLEPLDLSLLGECGTAVQRVLAQQGMELGGGRMEPVGAWNGAVAWVHNPGDAKNASPPFLLLGLGCDQDMKSAWLTAVLEVVRSAVPLGLGMDTLQEFAKRLSPAQRVRLKSVTDQGSIAQHLQSLRLSEERPDSTRPSVPTPRVDCKARSFRELPLEREILDCPLYLGEAVGSQALEVLEATVSWWRAGINKQGAVVPLL